MLSYGRAHSVLKAGDKVLDGQMAAVGLSKEEIVKILPENIYVACENSSTNVTISGPTKITRAFVNELISKGIFAKNVESGNFAFHSKHIEGSFPYMLGFIQNIIPDPKPRSAKWISTSVPDERSTETWAKTNCVEYHYNNYCNKVLFDRVFEHIPENAIVIEVAPHGLLQAILKREMGSKVTNLSIMHKDASDNEQFLLSIIGK